jgi:DNA-binding MarR family transcriptional regulator
MNDYDSPAARALLAIAGRRAGFDAARCHVVFAQLAAGARLRRRLRGALARHRLSDLQFGVLTVLGESGPEPVSMAVLARQTAVSRSAVTDALDGLVTLGLADRVRDRRDRRIMLARITAAGRGKILPAINDYLHALVSAASGGDEPATPSDRPAEPHLAGAVRPGTQ